MGAKLVWSDARNAELLALRQGGANWDIVSQRMGLSRNTVIDQSRRLGVAKRPGLFGVFRQPEPPPPPERDRDPFPPMHPVSWGVLVALTPSLATPA